MNIAIFTDAFYPQINGVVTSTMSLAENMIARGHVVYIVAPLFKLKDEFCHPDIKVIRLPSLPASFYDDFRWTTVFSYSTYRKLRKNKVDIVHFMTPIFVSYLGIKIGRMLKVPVIGTYHTFIGDPTYFKHLFHGPIRIDEHVAWDYANLYYNAADYVTAPTEKAVQIIKDHGCTPPSMAISNGIDLSIFDNSKSEEFKKKYNLGSHVILYVGRVAYEKNISELIKALVLLKSEVPDAQLLIIGDGPQREDFQVEAKGLCPDDSIIFTGAIPHDDLVKSGVFRCCQCFATASKTETQGITILEAQANGLVPVCAAAGGLIDLIDNGVNGFLCDPDDPEEMADRLVDILLERVDVKLMSQKTYDSTKEHHMDHVIDIWEELYTDLITRNHEGTLPKKDYLHLKSIVKIIGHFQVDLKYIYNKYVKWGLNKSKIGKE
ncbi:glycosyltransferase [Spirochaeta cellobiosiphila]|uniref:glycosyltransferase n=1 Tax=Spirochaeta cellobiosiphila TaxID=504483 RepID=UPI00040782F0|nr:glycosyltransferase [Spirochaeta cellobiosiphila]